MSPFDYVKIINTKANIPEDLNGYSQYIINRHYSYFPDTVVFAQEASIRKMTDEQHFKFMYYLIPKANRFAKWEKASKYDNVELIKSYYGYSDKLAHEIIELFSDNDIQKIKQKFEKGGVLK